MERSVFSMVFFICIFANAQNDNKSMKVTIIGEESYQGYKLERYSDETSKIFDKKGNWIHFFTEYDTNEFTGEVTNNPVKIQDFIPDRRWDPDKNAKWLPDIFEADIHNSKGYHLYMKDGEINIKTPIGCSLYFGRFIVKHEPYPLKKEGAEKEKEIEFYKKYGINRNGYVPRIITNTFLDNDIKKHFEDFKKASQVLGINYLFKGGKGELLKRVGKRSFQNYFYGAYYYEINNEQEVYYEESTHRIYEPLMERFFLIVSSKTGLDVASIDDPDNRFLDCLLQDTICALNRSDNVAEIRYTNGDYIYYSFLKNMIYDCIVHRPNGVFSITLEDNKPIARFEYTSGDYKGYTFVEETDYKIKEKYNLSKILRSDEIVQLETGAKFYNSKTKKKLDYSRGSLYDPETKTYAVLAGSLKQEMKEQERAKQQQEKELQPLYQKYGKKYVDSIFKSNKILIGTPEGLIVNHMSSSLVGENQSSRLYRIKAVLGGRFATVHVNKKTKTVSSVVY